MKITVNGNIETIEPCTIDEYVERKNLNPSALVVEHNQQIIQQQRWGEIQLAEDDILELLSFVGGG